MGAPAGQSIAAAFEIDEQAGDPELQQLDEPAAAAPRTLTSAIVTRVLCCYCSFEPFPGELQQQVVQQRLAQLQRHFGELFLAAQQHPLVLLNLH